MPKKTIKRYIPDPARLREIPVLRLLGERIYQPNLWHINRKSTSMAFFIGLFVAFFPVPAQMAIAGLMAIWLRGNLPLAVLLCWVTNPLTAGPMFWFAYRLGALIIGVIPHTQPFEISWQWLGSGLLLVWQPLLLGSLVCGFFFRQSGLCGDTAIMALAGSAALAGPARAPAMTPAPAVIPVVTNAGSWRPPAVIPAAMPLPAAPGPRAGPDTVSPQNTAAAPSR